MIRLSLQFYFVCFIFLVFSLNIYSQDLHEIPFQLPLFVISTNDQEIVNEPKINAHLGIINNINSPNYYGDSFNEYDGNIGIEIRGNGSQTFPKNSYLFETRKQDGDNFNVSILGLPKENDWVLYGPYIDITGMRNSLTYELSRAMVHYASRSEFCRNCC